MVSDRGDNEFDMKQSRLNNPSGWIELTRYETVRLLIDALLEAPPEYEFNKSELERRTGLSREAIRNHLPKLVELGIVNKRQKSGWAEYQLNDDGKVTQELFNLNSAVNSVLSGEPKNAEEEMLRSPTLSEFSDNKDTDRVNFYPIPKEVDNAEPSQHRDDLIEQPPTENTLINAD